LSWSKLILGLFLANCPIFGSDDFRCIVHWLSDSLHIAEWHPNHHRTNQLFNEFVAMFKFINSSNYKIMGIGNNEHLEDLAQALWALDNSKTDYARVLIIATIDLNIVTNSLK
jgi:hypothetical protein